MHGRVSALTRRDDADGTLERVGEALPVLLAPLPPEPGLMNDYKRQVMKDRRANRKAKSKLLTHQAGIAAKKLTEAGHPTTHCAGFAVIAMRIRDLRPDIRGCTRDVISQFAGPIPEPVKKAPTPAKKSPEAKLARAIEVRNGFYDSREWRAVRYQALKKHGGRCQCCGASAAEGATLHVDHIKPRSLWPSLELALHNLQVLCRDCNLGKSNVDSTDWRPALRVVEGGK